MEKDEIVLVCGYGCHLTSKLRGYLEHVARYLEGRSSVANVVLSGGYTQEISAPGISEADLMSGFLRRANISHPLVKEEAAVTTVENLRATQRLLGEELGFWDHFTLTIFCDSMRAFKVRYLARRIFRGIPLHIVPHDFRRSLLEKGKQYLLATPLEIFGFHFPAIGRRKRASRLAFNTRR